MIRLPFIVLLSLLPRLANASFTETVPADTFILDERIAYSIVTHHWNDESKLGPLIDKMERYEAGAGLQGTLIANADARYTVLVNFLNYGITDSITAIIAVPIVLTNTVKPDLDWEPGDYSSSLGRSYSADDFWDWAGSMGQPKPGNWEGDTSLSDIVLGARWRFSDDLLPSLAEDHLALAVTLIGTIRTGTPPDPEEIVSLGNTSWDLHMQGEFGIHLGGDKRFPDFFDDRLTVGLEVFYEMFPPQERESGTGKIHPLLANTRAYVGKTYTLDPGDLVGTTAGIDIIAIRGPAIGSWISGGDEAKAAAMGPLLTLSLQYNFTYVGQSDWQSNSAIWDWQQEDFWNPGYKNILYASATLSLLRLGVPLRLYGAYRTIALLPGKNVRAVNAIFTGVQVPLKFW